MKPDFCVSSCNIQFNTKHIYFDFYEKSTIK